MTERFTLMLKAACMTLVLTLVTVGDFLGWPPLALGLAGLAIFGAVTLLQIVFRSGDARQSHR